MGCEPYLDCIRSCAIKRAARQRSLGSETPDNKVLNNKALDNKVWATAPGQREPCVELAETPALVRRLLNRFPVRGAVVQRQRPNCGGRRGLILPAEVNGTTGFMLSTVDVGTSIVVPHSKGDASRPKATPAPASVRSGRVPGSAGINDRRDGRRGHDPCRHRRGRDCPHDRNRTRRTDRRHVHGDPGIVVIHHRVRQIVAAAVREPSSIRCCGRDHGAESGAGPCRSCGSSAAGLNEKALSNHRGLTCRFMTARRAPGGERAGLRADPAAPIPASLTAQAIRLAERFDTTRFNSLATRH
jgi:hypothetical protein